MTNNTIVCVFAHPDDEAFGPSGTIAKWAKTNHVHIICVTDGSNPNGKIDKLATIRKNELQTSAKILGVKRVFFLKFCDGELRNNIYHEVAREITKILNKLKPSVLLTFELRGVSGHIDHVFVSMVTSYLFRRLDYVRRIFYFAEYKLVTNLMKNYFIFFPEGYDREEVDYIEDVSSVIELKIKAAKAHKSQKADVDRVINNSGFFQPRNYF